MLLLIAMLASCGTTTAPEDTASPESSSDVLSADTETAVPEETAEPNGLPDINWEGKKFRVLGFENNQYSQFSTFEIDSEGETGEIVNDAIFRRNTLIEDTYGVEIEEIRDSTDIKSGNTTLQHLRTTVNAGEDLYDLAFASLQGIGTMAQEGMFCDMNAVDYIDFTRNWWNQDVNEVLEISDRLFFTNSDFSLQDKRRTYILVYNKGIVDQHNLGDPFELVKEGKWTLDVMAEWSTAVGKDVNGNGSVDFDDTFGFGFDSYNGFRTLAFGCGVEVVKNNDGVLELVLNNEHTVSAIEKILPFYTQDYIGTTCEAWKGKVDFDIWSVASRLFKEGRSLFIAAFPHNLSGFSADCVDDYGILPFGKYDEEQEKYYTCADRYGMLFGIPVTTSTPEFSGFMLEALSHASQTTSLSAYYEVSCKTKYTYDPQSAEMLDIVFDGIVFDPALIYDASGIASIFNTIAQAGTNNFASLYKQNEKKTQKTLEKLVKTIEELD